MAEILFDIAGLFTRVIFTRGTRMQMAAQLPEQQVAAMKTTFSGFDEKGDGKISATELGTVMKLFGENPTEADLKTMMEEADIDGNGTVSFDEFLVMMVTVGKPSVEDLRDAFKVVDKNGDGYITRSELKEALGNFSDENIDLLIKAVDTDGDGRVNYEELAKVMMATK